MQIRAHNLLLSLIIPCHNEEESLPALHARLNEWSAGKPFQIEICLVDDGSTDSTWAYLARWAVEDQRVSAIRLSRNFGHQLAVTAGLDIVGGDAAVILDADLQDPPEAIDAMIAAYRLGFDVVHGKRSRREGETTFKLTTAWLFYRMMKLCGATHFETDSGDFRLISRRCIETIKPMREQSRILRGLFGWVGLPQTSVTYERAPRAAGTTKYSLAKMVRLAWVAMLTFSTVPLKIATVTGASTAALAILYAIYAAARWAILGDTVKGWTTLILLTAGIGGITLLCLGIIGEYIGEIYNEVRKRPLYIIQESTTAKKTTP